MLRWALVFLVIALVAAAVGVYYQVAPHPNTPRVDWPVLKHAAPASDAAPPRNRPRNWPKPV